MVTVHVKHNNKPKAISDETIQEIRKLDIKEFAERLGDTLRRSGIHFMAYRNGGEKTPSVAITPSERIWKDFTTQGAYGSDVLSYFAYREWNEVELRGERFSYAIHQVCAIAGIPVKYKDGTILEATHERCVGEAAPLKESDADAKQNSETLDRFYRALLETLPLSVAHHDHLMNDRSMTQKEITARSYRTMTSNPQTRYKITKEVINLVKDDPEGIPGFYQTQGDYGPYWTLAGRDGYLVPFRNLKNQIVGLQLRVDEPDSVVTEGQIKARVVDRTIELTDTLKGEVLWRGVRADMPVTLAKGKAYIRSGSRYLWLSTYRDIDRKILKGAKIGHPTPAPFHVAVPSRVLEFWEPGDELSAYMDTSVVWLGEGPIKGDIAADYTDQVHLQSASVSAMTSMLEAALELKPSKVILAPDADAQTKTEEVGKAVLMLVEKAISLYTPLGISVEFAAWNVNQAKGLDDLLNLGFRPNFITLN